MRRSSSELSFHRFVVRGAVANSGISARGDGGSKSLGGVGCLLGRQQVDRHVFEWLYILEAALRPRTAP